MFWLLGCTWIDAAALEERLALEAAPDIAVATESVEFGAVIVGTALTLGVEVENRGDAALHGTTEVVGEGFGAADAAVDVAPGEAATVAVTFSPAAAGSFAGTLTLASDDPDAPLLVVALSGTGDDDADGDGVGMDDDCDDGDATIHPGAGETWYDGVDQDCSGTSDYDADVDGHDREPEGDDCDDGDAAIHPMAGEVYYDGVDQDCSGTSDYDADLDGHERIPEGADCADADATIHPGAPDPWYDGVDGDCGGEDDYDADGDGADRIPEGTDCDDADASAYPGAAELSYDGADNDCDGVRDAMVAEVEAGWTLVGARSSDAVGSGGVPLAGDLDGDGDADLIVCAPGANSSATTDIGMVSVHDAATAGLGVSHEAGWLTVTGNSADDFFGADVALGDIDGDGQDELVVGAYQNDAYADDDDGTVYVVSLPGLSGTVVGALYTPTTLYGSVADGWLGYAVAAGDMDGDGVDEVASGAPGIGGGEVYVTFAGDGLGDADLRAVDSGGVIRGGSTEDHLGYALDFGDVDGDGYADLVACAPDDDDTGSGSGTCWVVGGEASPELGGVDVDAVHTAAVIGGAAGDRVGPTSRAVAVGDYDDDGLEDLALGVPGDDTAVPNGGAVWIFANGTVRGVLGGASATWVVTGDGGLGTAVVLGDLTRDGVDDLLAGAPSAGVAGEGVVYLLAGAAPGAWVLPASQDASWSGRAAGDAFGTALGGAADLDGDGVEDFAAAAIGNDDAVSGAGKVYVLPGY